MLLYVLCLRFVSPYLLNKTLVKVPHELYLCCVLVITYVG